MSTDDRFLRTYGHALQEALEENGRSGAYSMIKNFIGGKDESLASIADMWDPNGAE